MRNAYFAYNYTNGHRVIVLDERGADVLVRDTTDWTLDMVASWDLMPISEP